MGEAEDRLVFALMEANARLSEIATEIRDEIRDEKGKIKATLQELGDEGLIDLDRLVDEFLAEAENPKAARRDILRPEK